MYALFPGELFPTTRQQAAHLAIINDMDLEDILMPADYYYHETACARFARTQIASSVYETLPTCMKAEVKVAQRLLLAAFSRYSNGQYPVATYDVTRNLVRDEKDVKMFALSVLSQIQDYLRSGCIASLEITGRRLVVEICFTAEPQLARPTRYDGGRERLVPI